MASKILIVDDELDICQILKYNLEDYGFKVDTACSAEEALTLNLSTYQLMLLDIMMEGKSGYELLEIIRNQYHLNTPVIFISAMGNDEDLEKGYSLGADDYIRKPFSVREVTLRVKALLERTAKLNEKAIDNVVTKIDNSQKRVIIGHVSVEFTRTEYDIFKLLYQQPGKVYSREEIINLIWFDHQNVFGRTVDVNITRIRKKLGNYGKCIVTRSGYGYCFDHRKVTIA